MTTVAVPQNWKSTIEQVVIGYETEPAKGLIHGLQKDLVQNGWGQRTDLENANDWGMHFTVVNNDYGKFLTVHDYGTYGMTGPNLSMEEINNLTGNLLPSYRLARFSAMNYSGGNAGAGLFGRGKLIFTAASKDSYYIYESLSDDGYRVNFKKLVGNTLKLEPQAFENDDAISFIQNETGLDPIETKGTRIIIINPIDELIDAIDNGKFLAHIEETWWPIVEKYDAKILITNSSNETFQAAIPIEYLSSNLLHSKVSENLSLRGFTKINKLKFGISKDSISEDLVGVYLYRKGMKMGEIPLNIPEEIQSKFFGYIEVDSEFEEHIIQIENLEHYGFTSKRTNVFQVLKQVVTNEFENFMEDTGYRNETVSSDDSLQNELLEVASELDNLLNDLNLPNGPKQSGAENKVILKWNGITFPNGKGNYLTLNDEVNNIAFTITNNYAVPKKFNVTLTITCEGRTIVSLLDEQVRILNNEQYVSTNFNFKITNAFIPGKRHSLLLSVSPLNTLKEDTITAAFYYDVEEKENTPTREFSLQIENIELPNEPSTRVNTNEELKNISYKIKNNSPYEANLGLNVSLYVPNRPKRLLENICLQQFTLPAHSETIISCTNVTFTKENYENVMLKGPIELRAILSATNDFGSYEQADIICQPPPFYIYLNQDDSFISQTFSSIQMLEGDELRSKVSGVQGNWTFSLYKDHPLYIKSKDTEEYRKEYIIEEMLKQTIYTRLAEGDISILAMFSEDMEDLEDLSDSDIFKHANAVIDKIQRQRHIQ